MLPIGKELSVLGRRLLRSPGFSAVAVLTLALGIGANTAIFSVVHGVLLRPLPFENPQELYGLWHSAPGIGIPEFEQSDTTYTIYHDLSESFVEVGLSQGPFFMNLTGVGEPVRVETASATAPLFGVLGVPTHLGRTFTQEEDDPGAPDVALVSYAFWQGRLGGDPEVLGRTLRLDGTPFEVVGVMAEGFDYPGGETEIWIPHVIGPEDLGRANFSYEAVGRLKPGVTVEAANTELTGLLKRMPEIYPGEITAKILESAQMSAHINPMIEDVVGSVSQILWVLLGTVSFVLLIACANVANLFLVRAEGRQRELALRTALGAGRLDLLRSYWVESLVLSLLGGLVGLGLAYAGLRGLVALSPASIPRLGEVGLHPPVLLFTALVALVSGLVFGAIPVLRYRRPNLVAGLNEGSLRASVGRETNFARSLLVVTQVALALVLLIGSGLMARSFWKLRNVDPGFVPEGLLTVRLSLPESDYPEPEDAAGFYERLFERLSGLPGVTGVGGVTNLPMTDGQSNNGVVLEDYPLEADDLPPIVRTNYATPGYFEAIGIPLREGRTFEPRDHQQRTGAAVVSASFANEHWPGESALGRRLTPGLPSEDIPWYTIVGVVGDIRDDGLEQDVVPVVYYPVIGLGGEYGDWTIRTLSIALRAGVDPTSLAATARDAIWALDPNLPLLRTRTGEEIVSESMARTSYTMILLSIASFVALFLGSIGIYGVISYIVSQRTREVGIRLALGAERAQVSRMVVRQGLVMTLVGVALGVALAFGATNLMSSLLFGVSSTDPATFVGLSIFLLGIATLASYVPARRAASLNPVEALHYE